jgi:electron transfer flavoprotein beta subunit
MHIIVCIKSVVRAAPGGVTKRTLENSELNAFDRPALEAALQLKEAVGGTVTALSMGPPVGSAALAEAQAMGIDRTVLVSAAALAGSDTLVTSQVLTAALARLAPFDFVFFGVRTSDSDTGQVGPQSAALLGLPFVSGVKKIEPLDHDWLAHRTLDEWEETWQVSAPAVMTIHPRAFTPRHVGLTGIARVYDQPAVETWGLSDVGLSPEKVGLIGSPTRVSALHKVKRSRSCNMLGGEPQEQVEALVERLINTGVMAS